MLTALLTGAKLVFTASEWKSGLETKNVISGIVLDFEIFGPLVFKLLFANRGISCVQQHMRIMTSPCVQYPVQGSWDQEEGADVTSVWQDGQEHKTPVLRGLEEGVSSPSELNIGWGLPCCHSLCELLACTPGAGISWDAPASGSRGWLALLKLSSSAVNIQPALILPLAPALLFS